MQEHHNADLVKIGVGVLRVDPEKEKQISAAREWALNLIDANAGGVKFSPEARARLLREPLKFARYDGSYDTGYDYSSDGSSLEPASPHTSAKPRN